MSQLVIVRHGQSLWNRERRFTGWSNVGLSQEGVQEARLVGQLLARRELHFDVAFTSYLDRAINTLEIVLATLGLTGLPMHETWRLNERHYGVIQGLSRPEGARLYGLRSMIEWQSGFEARPPAVDVEDERYPGHDIRYASVAPELLPRTESMRDTLERVLPYWHEKVAPEIRKGHNVLLVAHKTSLRALKKHLDDISDDAIAGVTVRTGEPIVYEMDAWARPIEQLSLRPASRLKRLAQLGIGRWLRGGVAKGSR